MDFNNYVAKGNQILDEVAEELGFPGNRKLAGRILRAVLHVLRERLTIEESFQMMAQLPLVIKGLYVDGWNIHQKPAKITTVAEFVREVVHEDRPIGHHDFTTAKDGENAVMAVFKVLQRHISTGEIADMIAVMPKELVPLWGNVTVK